MMCLRGQQKWKCRVQILWGVQRVARAEVCGGIYRMMIKRERHIHKEKELDRCLNPGFPVGRRFRNTN